MSPLRVALLGLGASGQRWLAALRASQEFAVVALADRDSDVVDAAAGESDATPYTDFRLALVEPVIDAAVVALPPFAAEPFLAVAARRGLPVLKETPLARRFEEAVRAIQAFYDADLPLVVASRWRFEPAVSELIHPPGTIVPVRLASASLTRDPGAAPGWRGDSVQAGGGVLLDAAYDALDLLVSCMGLPGDVSARLGRFFRCAGERFDTEDAASIFCRYGSGAALSLSASWREGPPDTSIVLIGEAGRAVLTGERMRVVPDRGEPTDAPRMADAAALSAILRSFAETVRTGLRVYPGRASDQLPTMAVLDAAYLAARTHAAESPAKAYELAGLPPPRIVGRPEPVVQ